ncbi:hypothetical protein AKJ64_01400 [candidate division MSBL1 archaeon SCGC-AAA259E17]|uniref:Uncharacterized protein n=1 Tax=candidate division MSBL1 archaeon SCGC-AAA259E17 TaxID=1698263 RepID=A0A133UG08_9EURY|nr:hypothetical protein AKJ64_01400 [candidate division MSBL1 archaeon SCGC-AAA259E17]
MNKRCDRRRDRERQRRRLSSSLKSLVERKNPARLLGLVLEVKEKGGRSRPNMTGHSGSSRRHPNPKRKQG